MDSVTGTGNQNLVPFTETVVASIPAAKLPAGTYRVDICTNVYANGLVDFRFYKSVAPAVGVFRAQSISECYTMELDLDGITALVLNAYDLAGGGNNVTATIIATRK